MAEKVDATTGPEIRFENITTSWAATRTKGGPAAGGPATRPDALSNLSLTVPAGEITVLLGDHRSGKSLLALHLLGELPPDTGRILVSDESVWDLPDGDRKALSSRFGVLRGGTALRETDTDTELSVFDNVVDELRDTEVADRAESVAHEVLRHFDLGDVEQMSPGDLDPAARRRLAIATALADDPEVVVIDDPGEALDSEHLEHMVESIRGWHARTRSTMVIGARSLRVARELADQVVVLKDGRVVSHGAPGTVLADVVDDSSYEKRFGTSLGGHAEADPERNRRGLRALNLAENRRQLLLVLAFFVLAVAAVIGLLTSGVLDQGTGDNGGQGAQTSGTSMGSGH